MNVQGQFAFESGPAEDGYVHWIAGRKMAAKALAARLGLPLGHQVEVWLRGNVRLCGMLRLKEERLFIGEEEARHLELVVDRVPFTYREMDSCIRLD